MTKKLLFFGLLLGCLTLARPGAAQVVQYLPPLVVTHAVPPGLVGVSQVVDARPSRPLIIGYSLSGWPAASDICATPCSYFIGVFAAASAAKQNSWPGTGDEANST